MASNLSADSFPYGEYLEAFPGALETFGDWAGQFKKDCERKKREALRSLGKPRNERRLLRKRLPPLSEFTFTPDMLDSIPSEQTA